MIPLTTDRLRLRPFRPGPVDSDDARFLRRLHANPDLIRFIPSAAVPDGETGDDVVATQLERFTGLAEHPVQGFSLVELAGTGEPVALIMVKAIPPSGGGEPTVLEIGWRQVAEHCGHGYVTEAARAVLDAVHDRGVTDVVAVTLPDNAASQAVAERIGMERVGESRDFYDETTVLFRSHRGRPAGTEWLPRGWELLPEGLYAFPGPLRDKLVSTILSGVKRTTTSLLAEHELEGEDPAAAVGAREVVVDSSGRPVAVTRTTEARVVKLADVTLEHAVAEGEGHASVAAWRADHEGFWRSSEETAWFREQGAAPPTIDDDTPVVCWRFEVEAQDPAAR